MEVVQLLGVAGVLAAPGTQGSWCLGQQEICALEGYGNQYWPIHCSILAWRTTLTEKPGRPQSTGWQRLGHDRSDSACIDSRRFFACGISAPVRVEPEGGAAAWLVGTLVAPSVQGHGLPLL